MKKSVWYYLKRTYNYALQEKRYFYYFFITCVLLCGIEVVSPLIAAQKIVALTGEIWGQLLLMVGATFVIEIIRNVVNYFYSLFSLKYYFAVKKNLQDAVAKETLKIEMNTLNQNSSGVFIERINNDTDVLADIFSLLVDEATYLITTIGIFISIFFLNKFIFILYLIFIFLLIFLQKRSAEKVAEKREIEKRMDDKASGFISELVRGAKDIKILDAEESFLQKSKEITWQKNQTFYDTNLVRNRYRLVVASIRDILDFLIMTIGIYFIIDGQLAVATMLVILNYRGNIVSISSEIENFLNSLKSYSLAAERIFDVIDDEYPKEKFGTKKIKKATGEIEFRNVSFQYDDNEVLKNINFKIKPNEIVSFVGKSGAGKSTIFNLIAKLYDVTKGEILFDGIPINELDKASIRGNLSIISQSPYIFNMSIRDNLKIIKSDLTETEMIKACKMACLHDFVMSLKDGYDTLVGEGGVTLSGGQRQRLAIARALILKTEIILFDEATSALDNETQNEIQKSILNMQGKYTILIIAHRLSTVINSDRLILLDDGKIIGMGTHEELLQNNDTYKKLYELELKKSSEVVGS